MWVHKGFAIVWTVMLATSAIAADGLLLPAAPAHAVPDTAQTLFRQEAPRRRLDSANGWSSRYDPETGTRMPPGKTTALAPDSSFGLNWTLDGQPPSLEYRFSQNGTARFRGSRHGVKAFLNWDF